MSVTQEVLEQTKPEPGKVSKCDDIVCLIFEPGLMKTFPVSNFETLRDLSYLCLAGNNLVEIGKELFTAFPCLSWLDLRNNKLLSFPRFVNHACLETILLGGNKIKRLPIELGSFKQLSCLQASGNPLEFPNDIDFGQANCDIISFLRLCWQQKTEKPIINLSKTKKTYQAKVSKSECLQPVKHFRNVSNVLLDKIKSSDPIDQVLAEHVAKKLRNIEKQLQKSKDREFLKSWREKYMGKGVARRQKDTSVPFGTDEKFSKVISRGELNNFRKKPREKKNIIKIKKPTINIDEEIKKLQDLLGNIKNHKTDNGFPPQELSQTLFDLKEINEIQKRIKTLQMAN